MKKNTIKLPTASLESLVNDVRQYNVISNEGIGDLFNSLIDNSKSLFTRVFNFNSEKAYNDAVEDKFQVIRFMQGFTNVDLSEIVIVVPDRFTGSLPLLIDDLGYAYNSFMDDLIIALGVIDLDISDSINNAGEGKLFTAPRSIVNMRNLKKKRTVLHDKLSKNFTLTKTKTHSKMINHFRSTKEVIGIYPKLQQVEAVFSKVPMTKLWNESAGISEKVGILIEKIESLGPTVRADLSLKETTEAIYELGKCLEFVGYMQATLLQVYGSVNSIGKNVINYHNL